MRNITASRCVLTKRRGQNYTTGARIQRMLPDEVARKFVILAAGDDKFYLILAAQRVKVFHAKRIALAGVRTFYVHDLYHSRGNPLQWPFPASLQKYGVS